MDNEDRFYIVDGESLPLTRLPSARLVVPINRDHLSPVAARLARSSRLTMATAAPRHVIVVRGDANKLEEIRHDKDIRCTRSAFLDAHGHELFLTDEVLVRFAETLDDTARRELCRKLNCIVVSDTKDIWRIRVEDTDDDAPLDVSNLLSAEPGVVFAEPNALQAATYAAEPQLSDAWFQTQWHLHNIGQKGVTIGADVRALTAWAITTGSPSIPMAVHDNGIDINHPDLIKNIDPGKELDNDDNDASNNDGPYGTTYACVIAAVRNDQGVVGIASGCRIVPLRIAGAHTWEVWADTFDWAAAHGDIISCSWSISRNSTFSESIKKAVREGRGGKGISVFCATGDGFSSVLSYPANLSETIGVGSSGNEGMRAPYSPYGDGIDFIVPSNDGTLGIETTDVCGTFRYNPKPNGDYSNVADVSDFGGISSATPLAAGVAALMLSVNNNLTAEQVRAIMRDTCEKIDQSNGNYDGRGWSAQYGYGRLNAAAAVKRAQELILLRVRGIV